MLQNKSLKSCEEKLGKNFHDLMRTLKKEFEPAVGKMKQFNQEITTNIRSDVSAITKSYKKMKKRLEMSKQKKSRPVPSVDDSLQPQKVAISDISDCKSNPLPSVDNSFQLQEVVFSVCKSIPVPSVDSSQLQEVVISDGKDNPVPPGGKSSETCVSPLKIRLKNLSVVDLDQWEKLWRSSVIEPKKITSTFKYIPLNTVIILFALFVILFVFFLVLNKL